MKSFLNWLAAAASLVGLFFTLTPPSSSLSAWQILFLALVIIVFGGAAFMDIRSDLKKAAKKYKSQDEINNYMYDMLKNSGACEVCSRDATWVSVDRIFVLLQEKATKKELTFLVHTKNSTIKRLEGLGASVIEYGKLGFDPITRFTIVNSGNPNSSYVAIGRKRLNEPHTIEELDGSHPTYSMAADLIRSVKLANDLAKKRKEP